MLEGLLWLALLILAYIYVGYPMLAVAAARLLPNPVRKASHLVPVTVIITAYNEERDINAKLGNTLLIEHLKKCWR